jgi:hypothetical protein
MDQEAILRAAAEAAKQVHEPQLPLVMPQAVPMAWQIGAAQDNQGNKFVRITVSHPMGVTELFLQVEGADQIGDAIKNAARLSRTGLEIAK